MKILIINSVCGVGSTGRLCVELAQKFENEGHEVKIAYGREDFVPEGFQKYAIRIGNDLDVKLHGMRTRFLDQHGLGSLKATKKFIKWADSFSPDLLWLHNIHGYYINVELLFDWIKKRKNMEVKWTLHDCWAFTGHCAHFTAISCEKWKEQCFECLQKNMYPASILIDNSKKNYIRKKNAFTGVKNLTIITPSQWLADLVKLSFLNEYPVDVKYNKIDTTIYKPIQSDFRKKYSLGNKKIILGVASTWTERKGLYDFIKLSKMLNKDYVIVLVGISETELKNAMNKKLKNLGVNRKQSEKIIEVDSGIAIPCDVGVLYNAITGSQYQNVEVEGAKIIGIPRTNDVKELAEIYTASDVFVNPTYEDTYPTVNLEARACGTKVITYNIGGCLETLQNKIEAE